ncbi:FixH family protein [Bradyrhizobium sp. LMTR 3]|uniref:FixH family protein n=1 Tax=Bradyrhizobium sp. LMTR 3 TaxID=189873 RepID=UPI00159F2EE0|nr:FixH family protein [Bradyrhizobium sp. LMTR 3]
MLVAVAALTAGYPQAAHGQVRAKAAVTCVSAGQVLEYDCTIRLANARSGEPLSGLTVSVGADMPSMPGMHNVRAVKATEQAEKGAYKVRLELEMHGDWAVQIDLRGAVRDRVISMLRFEEADVTDVKPSSGRRGH